MSALKIEILAWFTLFIIFFSCTEPSQDHPGGRPQASRKPDSIAGGIVSDSSDIKSSDKYYQAFKGDLCQLRKQILENNLQKARSIYRKMVEKGFEGFDRPGRHCLDSKYINLEEKSDTSTLKFLFEEVRWQPTSIYDSAYRIFKSIEFQRYDMLTYYTASGWSYLYNISFSLSESGDGWWFDQFTPLDYAMSLSDTVTANFLTKSGAEMKKHCLSHIVENSLIDFTVKKLIEKGMSVKEAVGGCLHYPIRSGNLEKVDRLIALGANIDEPLPSQLDRTPVFMTMTEDEYRMPGEYGGNLDTTIFHNKLKILGELLISGANVNYQDRRGYTPLMYLILHDQVGSFRLQFAKTLIQNGASLDIKDNSGNTLWDYLGTVKNKRLIEFFTENGLAPNEYKLTYDSLLE